MKKCTFCGKENKDSGKFCTGCGRSLEDAVIEPDPVDWKDGAPAPAFTPAPAPAPTPTPAPTPAPAPKTAAVRRTPAQEKLKELASSPLALIICIAFTVMLLCSIYASAAMPVILANKAGGVLDKLDEETLANVEDFLNDNFDMNVDLDLDEILDAFDEVADSSYMSPASFGTRMISSVSGNALSILFAVALWIVYGVAKQEDSVCCGTTGLKIMRVLRTLGLILGIILMVLIALAMAFGLYMFAREGYNGSEILLAIDIVLAVIFILVLLFLIGIVRTLKKLISVSENSESRGRISGYAAFWLYVGGVCAGLGALGAIGSMFSLGVESGAWALSNAAEAVYCFALGRFFSRSRKALGK